jgi:hypothetical protein
MPAFGFIGKILQPLTDWISFAGCCIPKIARIEYFACNAKPFFIFLICGGTMVCIHGWTLQKQFPGSSGTWYRTNLTIKPYPTHNQSKHFPL